VDTARAILDGHILLSRAQTQMGIYPAVDIPASVSRVMNEIVPEHVAQAARNFRRLMTNYLENRDLVLMGGYARGQDPSLDEAIQIWPQLVEHIMQAESDKATMEQSLSALTQLVGRG